MKKKTINQLIDQLHRCKACGYSFRRYYFAYERAFVQHFGCMPHSLACKEFIRLFGTDYPR